MLAPDPQAESGAEPLLAVTRALEVLEWLAQAPEGLAFPALRQRLGTNQGAAFKILATLERSGWLFRSEDTGRYLLTYKLNNLGLTRLSRSRLLQIAQPALRNLAEASGELVRLAVVERDSITWVLALAGANRQQHTLQIVPGNKLRIGLNTHAAGKAWLSCLPWPEAWALLQAQGLERRTPHSLVTEAALRADLEAAAARGFATSFEENELSIGAIAVPILAPGLDGVPGCVGSVSVAAPTGRMDRATLEAQAPAAMECARGLGAAWPLNLEG